VRQRGPDELDGPGEVGGDDVADLLVGQFLGRAEQAVSGVAHDEFDAPEGLEAADGADDGVAAVGQLGGQLAAEAAADAGDEPVPGRHVSVLLWMRARSR
jgi:hypothetical protein